MILHSRISAYTTDSNPINGLENSSSVTFKVTSDFTSIVTIRSGSTSEIASDFIFIVNIRSCFTSKITSIVNVIIHSIGKIAFNFTSTSKTKADATGKIIFHSVSVDFRAGVTDERTSNFVWLYRRNNSRF